jgi:hypothetical protein
MQNRGTYLGYLFSEQNSVLRGPSELDAKSGYLSGVPIWGTPEMGAEPGPQGFY